MSSTPILEVDYINRYQNKKQKYRKQLLKGCCPPSEWLSLFTNCTSVHYCYFKLHGLLSFLKCVRTMIIFGAAPESQKCILTLYKNNERHSVNDPSSQKQQLTVLFR